MNEIKIDVQYTKLDHDKHEANIGIKTTNINGKTKVIVDDVFVWLENTIFLNIINSGEVSFLEIEAGDAYPISMLGNIIIEIPKAVSVLPISDLRRFKKKDASLHLIFDKEFKGSIYAIRGMEQEVSE